MARCIHADGSEHEVKPARNGKWTLDELRQNVDGDIELIPGSDWGMGRELRIVADEFGRLKRKPKNEIATGILHEAMAKKMGCSVSQLSRHVGHRLRYLPEIHGTVLVLDEKEKM